MKVPGVIGGLGPQTTADFYMRVQELARQQGIRCRPPVIIRSASLPYELEERAIRRGEGMHEIRSYLARYARQLEKAGADFIVMPCNTLHVLADSIQSGVTIPFVSIVDETAAVIKKQSVSKLALLATGATISTGIYNHPLERVGVEVIVPSAGQQERLNQMVVRLTNNEATPQDKVIFRAVLGSLKQQGAVAILLACTDFHILCGKRNTLPVIDTIEVLAQATLREMLRE